MSSTNPEHNLTPDEIEKLNRLEAVSDRGLETYAEVSDALAEIRDRHLYRGSHASFESYARERWGVHVSDGQPMSQPAVPADTRATPKAKRRPHTTLPEKPCEALALACEQTLSALSDEERMAIEIRLAVHKPGDPGTLPGGQAQDQWEAAEAIGDELVPTLRWLLTQASGTIGRVAHQLELRAADVDDEARDQLSDDVLVLDDELSTLKALLLALIDWDSEFARLLRNELPPFDAEQSEDDE